MKKVKSCRNNNNYYSCCDPILSLHAKLLLKSLNTRMMPLKRSVTGQGIAHDLEIELSSMFCYLKLQEAIALQ